MHLSRSGRSIITLPKYRETRQGDVEPRHDEDTENVVSEDRLQQPGHAGLAVVSPEFENEGDGANESNKICRGVRFLDTYETVDYVPASATNDL